MNISHVPSQWDHYFLGGGVYPFPPAKREKESGSGVFGGDAARPAETRQL